MKEGVGEFVELTDFQIREIDSKRVVRKRKGTTYTDVYFPVKPIAGEKVTERFNLVLKVSMSHGRGTFNGGKEQKENELLLKHFPRRKRLVGTLYRGNDINNAVWRIIPGSSQSRTMLLEFGRRPVSRVLFDSFIIYIALCAFVATSTSWINWQLGVWTAKAESRNEATQ